jgi:hypothetical protein
MGHSTIGHLDIVDDVQLRSRSLSELDSRELPPPSPKEMDAQQPLPPTWTSSPAVHTRGDSKTDTEDYRAEYYQSYQSVYDQSSLETEGERTDSLLGSPPPYMPHQESNLVDTAEPGLALTTDVRSYPPPGRLPSSSMAAPPFYAQQGYDTSGYIPYRPFHKRRIGSGQGRSDGASSRE